ncbi:MAG: helix-turn-helix domain-containing protein [Victivallales bacterium]
MPTNLKVISWKVPLARKYCFNELFMGERKSLVIVQRVDQTDTLIHSHDFTELVFILSGSAVHEVGKMRYEMRPGDFFLIDNRTRHAYKNCRTLKLVNVLVQERFLDHMKKMLSSIKGFDILFPHDKSGSFVRPPNLGASRLEECLILVNKIERELFESGPASNEMQSLLTTELLITACRFAELKEVENGSLWPNMEKALSYVQGHFNEEINVDKLCALASMSKRSFMRYFMRTTGYSPIQYLLKIRVLKACQFLRETDKPLSEISSSCGFDDTNYFSRIFRKSTGLPPNTFRKKTNFGIQP